LLDELAAGGEPIQLQVVPDENGQEVRLYCYSAARAEKEKALERRFAERRQPPHPFRRLLPAQQ
jgi:hypothetical protein